MTTVFAKKVIAAEAFGLAHSYFAACEFNLALTAVSLAVRAGEFTAEENCVLAEAIELGCFDVIPQILDDMIDIMSA